MSCSLSFILEQAETWEYFFPYLIPEETAALVQVNKLAQSRIVFVCRNQNFVQQIFKNKLFELEADGKKLLAYVEAAFFRRPGR